MLTVFGKTLRNIRMDRGLLLKDMAKKLGYNSSSLSSMENGNVNISPEFVDRLGKAYDLTDEEIAKLHDAARRSVRMLKVEMTAYCNSDRDLIYDFVTKIDQLNSKEKQIIKQTLLKGEGNDGRDCKADSKE